MSGREVAGALAVLAAGAPSALGQEGMAPMELSFASALMPAPAGSATGLGEFVFSFYGGKSLTFDSDLHVRAPGGTAVTYESITLEDESFDNPIFFGVRLSYWFQELPELGLCVDFTHAKTIADTTDAAERHGTIGGEPVSGRGPISETLSGFQLSHGLNTLTFNVMYRWFLGEGGGRDETWLGRLQPYLGVGAGVAIPHVEVDLAPAIGGQSTNEYQFAGLAAQVFLGANYDLAEWGWGGVSAFAEYKLVWAGVEADVNGGGTIRLSPWTNQFILGLSLRF